MNKEVKTLWVEALRSGKYKQGTGALRNDKNEYCCLGVLCDVARKEGIIPSPRRAKDENVYEYGTVADRRGGTLPSAVYRWAGLYDGNPTFGPNGAARSAASWNDHHHKSFEEIADLIEEHL